MTDVVIRGDWFRAGRNLIFKDGGGVTWTLTNGSEISVTSISGSGIAPGSISNTDLADMAAGTLKGRAAGAGTGAPQDLVASQVKTILAIDLSSDVTGTLQAAQEPAHTGDVTNSVGSLALTIAADAVTNAKAANMADSTIKGRAAGAGTGDPQDLTAAQVKAILALTAGDIGGLASAQQGPPGDDGLDGDHGPPGERGVTGATGATGTAGAIGPPGDDGLDGDHGPPGERGVTGATGATGTAGAIGPPGDDGLDGDHGPPGERGVTGTTGAVGPLGPPGDDGLDGDHGPPGERGAVGSTGAVGPLGPPGDDGLDGDHGPPGEKGVTGTTGSVGPLGPPGDDGLDGDHGPPGERGVTGTTGAVGPLGPEGQDGLDGDNGPPGERGATGATGPVGPLGPPGEDGMDGDVGPVGPTAPFANPTGLIGMLAVNGVAVTADRSDSTHAIDPAITPTWTALHTFAHATGLCIKLTQNAAALPVVNAGTLMQLGAADGVATSYALDVFANQANFKIRRANTTAASPTGLVANDVIGAVTYSGWDNVSAYNIGVQVKALATETWSATAAGAKAQISVVPNTTLVSRIAFQIDQDGTMSAWGPTAAALTDVTPDTGTFTGTLTGMTGSVTGTCRWNRVGACVHLFIPIMTGTSNTTAFTLTGLPAAIQPTRTQAFPVAEIENNTILTGTFAGQVAAASGTITFLINGNAAGFTASGTKGFAIANVVTWTLF